MIFLLLHIVMNYSKSFSNAESSLHFQYKHLITVTIHFSNVIPDSIWWCEFLSLYQHYIIFSVSSLESWECAEGKIFSPWVFTSLTFVPLSLEWCFQLSSFWRGAGYDFVPLTEKVCVWVSFTFIHCPLLSICWECARWWVGKGGMGCFSVFEMRVSFAFFYCLWEPGSGGLTTRPSAAWGKAYRW